VLKRDRPLASPTFHVPARKDIDARIFVGPAIFGLGWGLGGFCPGPALTALGLGQSGTLVFVPAMFAGMWGARRLADGGYAARTA